MPLPAWEQTETRAVVVLSLAAVFLGLIGAAAAFVLFRLIMLFTNIAFYQQFTFMIRYPPEPIAPWMVVLPVIGGLIVGSLAQFGTPRIRGHGIPEAMEAIITKESRVGLRVAVLKPLSAAIAVGTGGPFGAEGPIIQTGGAIGSVIGQTLGLTAAERKVFLACGAAAGMTGIFNTPITSVALALELLLFEFRPRSLVPVIVASAVSAAARVYLIGPQRMYGITPSPSVGVALLPYFIPLGIIIGVAAVGISKALFRAEQFFDFDLHLPMIVGPAVGGLVLGLIALVEPLVLGMGYATIRETIEGRFGLARAAELAVAKSLALIVTLGSGTSGGLLAPMLLIGASIGSVYGQLVNVLLPSVALNPEVCAIVAMSALFGSAARVPITSFLFGFELTGDYNAILPLMIGCIVADIVARLLTGYSVMTERLARRGIVVPQRYEADILTYLKVRTFMRLDFHTVTADTPIRQVLAEVRTASAVQSDLVGGPWDLHPQVWVVVRPDGTTVGYLIDLMLLQAQGRPEQGRRI